MTTMPEVIARYYKASEEDDVAGLVDCFTDDAWVVDEGRRYDGHQEILGWRTSTSAAYTYTIEIVSVTELAPDSHRVDTRLTGTFPGGVADLAQRFTLRDGLIAQLEG